MRMAVTLGFPMSLSICKIIHPKSAVFLKKCDIMGDLGIGGAMPQGRGMLISMTMIQIT